MQRYFKAMAVVAAVLIGSVTGFGATLVVDEAGSPDTYPDLASAFAIVSGDPADSSHVIEIWAGSYADINLTMPVSVVSVTGAGADVVTFTDPGAGTNDFIDLSGRSRPLTISDIAVNDYQYAFEGTGVDSLAVEDCTFDGNDRAVYMSNCSDGSFSGLAISGGDYVVVLDGASDDNNVTGCVITGAANDGVYIGGTSDGNLVDQNTIYDNGGYAVNCRLATTNNDIQYNCFYEHPGVEGWDEGAAGTNEWRGNYYNDNAAPLSSYVIAGGSETDWWVVNADNSAVPAVAGDWEVLSTGNVLNIEWTAPPCDPDYRGLAGYEFVLHYDPAMLGFEGAAYEEYLGPLDGSTGAVYTGIAVDEVAGEITFAAANTAVPGLGDGLLATVAFEVLDIGAHGISISSVYRDVDNQDIPVTTTAPTFSLVDGTIPVIVSASLTDDTVSAKEGCREDSLVVELEVTADVHDNWSLANVYFRFDATGTWSALAESPVAVSGTDATVGPMTIGLSGLSLANGDHFLEVLVLDASSNYSETDSLDFYLDKVGPVIASMTVSDQDACPYVAGWTDDDVVAVSVAGDGTEAFMRYYDGALWHDIEAFASDFTVTLAAYGSNDVWVQLYDAQGVCGGAVMQAIIYDTLPPVTSTDFDVSPLTTKNPAVTWSLSNFGGGDRYQWMVAEDPADFACDAAGWTDVTGPVVAEPYTFTDYTSEAWNTLYLIVRDSALNMSLMQSDTVYIDTTTPSDPIVRMLDASDLGDDCTDNYSMKVEISWTGDATWYRLSADGGTSDVVTWSHTLGTSPDTVDYPMPAGPCNKDTTVWVQLSDDLNNYTGWASDPDGIYVDCNKPVISNFVVLDLDYTDGSYPGPHINYTNDADVLLEFVTSEDILGIWVSEDAFATDSTWLDAFTTLAGPPDTLTFEYTLTSTLCPTPVGAVTVSAKSLDCSGRLSDVQNDAIIPDLPTCSPPDITAFTADTDTKDLSVNVNVTATDDIIAWGMRIYELAYPDSGAGWVAFSAASAYTLADVGDGDRDISIEVCDAAGNITGAGPVVCNVDTDVPGAGTFTIISDNPMAAPGYTNLAGAGDNYAEFVIPDPSVAKIYIKTWNNTWNTGWVDATSPIDLGALQGPNPCTFNYYWQDFALNQSPMYSATIWYDATAPAAPTNATGAPGASIACAWDAVGDGYKYLVRYNRTWEFPTYGTSDPAHPADETQGFFDAYVDAPACAHAFPGPAGHPPDIYAISVFTIDSAGNCSGPNVEIMETNYILGDLAPFDGIISFTAEFGAFANGFGLSDGDDGWDPLFDIGPTSDATATGLPRPDQTVNIEDLMIFAFNYEKYPGLKSGPKGKYQTLSASQIAMTVEKPHYLPSGVEYTVAVKVDLAEVIKGYHLVFSYDRENIEVVSVEAGAMYESIDKSFFYVDRNSENIDVSSVIFGADARFEGEELMRMTFRTKQAGEIVFEEHELDVRDRRNQSIEVAYNTVGGGILVPTEFALSQNYPNPFNPATTIELSLPVAGEYTLTIYNVVGQVVERFEGYAEASIVNITWDASRYSSGIYLYRVQAGDFAATRKMVLLK